MAKKATRPKAAGEKPKRRKSPSANSGQRKSELNQATSATPEVEAAGFPVVGIGASAGGLEALEQLLGNMPVDSGMAFVVVTHQHPGHTSLLPELLSRETKMVVSEATDGTILQPNHVYVGTPGGHLAIFNGTLQRMETDHESSPKLPIDYFFRSPRPRSEIPGDLHRPLGHRL